MAAKDPVAIDEFTWEVADDGTVTRSLPAEVVDKATVERLHAKLAGKIASIDAEIVALQVRRDELVRQQAEFNAVLQVAT